LVERAKRLFVLFAFKLVVVRKTTVKSTSGAILTTAMMIAEVAMSLGPMSGAVNTKRAAILSFMEFKMRYLIIGL